MLTACLWHSQVHFVSSAFMYVGCSDLANAFFAGEFLVSRWKVVDTHLDVWIWVDLTEAASEVVGTELVATRSLLNTLFDGSVVWATYLANSPAVGERFQSVSDSVID